MGSLKGSFWQIAATPHLALFSTPRYSRSVTVNPVTGCGNPWQSRREAP